MINTPCRDCIFAIYDDKTQVGCKLGRLDLFRKAGIEPVECFDDEKEFYVIPNRFCLSARNPEWGKRFKEEYWEKLVFYETQIQYNVIIIAQNSTLEKIESTCNSFLSQTIKPKHFTVIFDTLKPPKIGRILDKTEIKWRLQHVQGEFVESAQVDLVEDIIKHPYYVVVDAGTVVEQDLSDVLQTRIIDEFRHFALVKNWKGTKQIVPRAIHSVYSGNSEFSYESKLIKDGFTDKIFDGNF